jgi:2-polyprenyl-3-methyl-5-hydroxy-6-metoxy-1,4-benzoquinol methylase
MIKKISCLVDNHPKFIHQSILWLHSIISSGTATKDEIVLHVVEGTDVEFIEYLKNKEIEVQMVPPFGKGNAVYCNKLQQLHSPSLDKADIVVLCDTDLMFVENISSYLNLDSHVAGKIVDMPCPPLEVLQGLFQFTNIRTNPKLVPVDFNPEELTFESNCNGGFYILKKEGLKKVRDSWVKWAKWCLEKEEILGQFAKHADQLGFCFAVMEMNLTFKNLPTELNFPTHFNQSTYQKRNINYSPKVLHYHSQLTPNLQLKEIGIPIVDEVIRKANDGIHKMHRSGFSNKFFWDYRYKENPDLGSGVGSRGEVLEYKRNLIYPILSYFKEKEVLDVGCGDLELMRNAPSKKYTGIDISSEAIESSRKKRPDWNFLSGDLEKLNGETYDLVTCFDVLIHQSSESAYNQMVEKLAEYTTDTLIIGAYDNNPHHTSSITFYYEPISKTIEKTGAFEEIEKIGEYRDVSVIMARKKSSTSVNPNDIPFVDLCKLSEQSETPDLLDELINLSRTSLGFYPKTTIRVFEYPWIIKETVSNFATVKGLKITDIGAGVNVVPIWLSNEGAKVTTIDPHPLTREIEEKHEWNEWGFLDYSTISDGNILSLREDASSVVLSEEQDLIYSVSVIEHLPAKVRRAIIANAFRLLKKDGLLLLTLDMVPNSNKLWNLSEGKKVESSWLHGTLKSILRELKRKGFKVLSYKTQRNIYKSRTDVAYIVAQKKNS